MNNKNIDGGTMDKKTYINIGDIKLHQFYGANNEIKGYYGVIVNGRQYKNVDTYELVNELHRNDIVVKGYER